MGELEDILEQFLVAEPPVRENYRQATDKSRTKKYKFPRRVVEIPNEAFVKGLATYRGNNVGELVRIAPSLKEWIRRYGTTYGFRLEEDLVNEAVSMFIGLLTDEPYIEAQELQ